MEKEGKFSFVFYKLPSGVVRREIYKNVGNHKQQDLGKMNCNGEAIPIYKLKLPFLSEHIRC